MKKVSTVATKHRNNFFEQKPPISRTRLECAHESRRVGRNAVHFATDRPLRRVIGVFWRFARFGRTIARVAMICAL
jgi:hypothetical protein